MKYQKKYDYGKLKKAKSRCEKIMNITVRNSVPKKVDLRFIGITINLNDRIGIFLKSLALCNI